MKIGRNIRKLRELNNLTQKSLAEALGMSVVQYGRIERDEVEISLTRVEAIAKILNSNIETILNFDTTHLMNVQNNNGVIYLSTHHSTLSTINKDILDTVLKLNNDVLKLTDIISRINQK